MPFPSRGPKAAGWGRFLEELKIGQDTALRYMALAGYVDADEDISRKVRETGELPTYREAGIVAEISANVTETRLQVARAAGISHDTLRKADL